MRNTMSFFMLIMTLMATNATLAKSLTVRCKNDRFNKIKVNTMENGQISLSACHWTGNEPEVCIKIGKKEVYTRDELNQVSKIVYEKGQSASAETIVTAVPGAVALLSWLPFAGLLNKLTDWSTVEIPLETLTQLYERYEGTHPSTDFTGPNIYYTWDRYIQLLNGMDQNASGEPSEEILPYSPCSISKDVAQLNVAFSEDLATSPTSVK